MRDGPGGREQLQGRPEETICEGRTDVQATL
jgi:hypothetical protein